LDCHCNPIATELPETTALKGPAYGYLYTHGHPLALAQHVLVQACAKVNPATTAAFFCETLNNGGSAHDGLGARRARRRRRRSQALGRGAPAAVREPQH
jgi:hypothetical protein